MIECCNYPMLEVEGAENENGECEVVGYICEICHEERDLNGKVIKEGKI